LAAVHAQHIADHEALNWSGLPLTSLLAIGLWAIRKGMVKSAVQPKSGFPCTGPLQGVPRHEIQTAPEEKLWS
jgi:hypothetical protein